MFTGLIEEVGEIVAIEELDDSWRLTVRGPIVVSDASRGDSIQVSGVCLTVVDSTEETFTADVMGQTLNVSALGDLRVGSKVNLERAARADTRLGGHIVQGHVDGVGTVVEVRDEGQWRVIRFSIDEELAPMLVDKGSVTVAGVSLTVSTVSDPTVADHWFEVSLIPETMEKTTLGDVAVGDRVNIETDMIARHVARMLAFRAQPQNEHGGHEA